MNQARHAHSLAIASLSVALAILPAGCHRADAGTAATQAGPQAGATQARPLVVLEKTTRDGKIVAVPLAEEYRDVRPAAVDGNTPPIPPSELWPAQ